MPHRLRIAFASAELSPWASTGGLGEVAAALPKALAGAGCEVAVYVPLYRTVKTAILQRAGRLIDTGVQSAVWIGGHRLDSRIFRILGAGEHPDHPGTWSHPDERPEATPTQRGGRVRYYAVDCPMLYDREGIYGHVDEPARFSNFARAVLNTSSVLLGGPPDVVHGHDWHAALLPVYLYGPYRHLLPRTAAVLTIHNLAYQGVFSATELATIGLDPALFRPDLLEFHGLLNWLKGGICAADAVTTVSPRYAQEIRTSEFGEKLEGVLRFHERKLYGILNGIDTEVWNPQTDRYLPARYSPKDMAGKGQCRAAVLKMAHMDPNDSHPLFGVVSRLNEQKGLDLVADLVPYLASRSVRLLLLGSGDPALQARFEHLEREFPQHVRVRIGFEPDLAHVLQGASDAMLMPSRYEPCGLSQMYAMRYGTVPIVRAVGGLADTVVPLTPRTAREHTATGFTYDHDTHSGLQWAIDRALDTFYTDQPSWRALQHTGMTTDFSWDVSAQQYLAVYRHAMVRARD